MRREGREGGKGRDGGEGNRANTKNKSEHNFKPEKKEFVQNKKANFAIG